MWNPFARAVTSVDPEPAPERYQSKLELVNIAASYERPDVDVLAASLEIEINDEVLDPDCCGWIMPPAKNYGPLQVVRNMSHSETRRRFTTAHMIGHMIMHRDLLTIDERRGFPGGCNDDKSYRQIAGMPFYNPRFTARRETEANQIAVHILMSTDVVTRLRDKGLNAFQIADRLQVTPKAASIRLKMLAPASS